MGTRFVAAMDKAAGWIAGLLQKRERGHIGIAQAQRVITRYTVAKLALLHPRLEVEIPRVAVMTPTTCIFIIPRHGEVEPLNLEG